MRHGTIAGYQSDKCRCDQCCDAYRNYQRDWYRRNRERVNAAAKVRRDRNIEAVRKRDREAKAAARAANPEKDRDYMRAYYAANRDQINLMQRGRRLENLDYFRSREKKYRDENIERKRAQALEYYDRNRDKRAEWDRQYRSRNTDAIRQRRKEYRISLTDSQRRNLNEKNRARRAVNRQKKYSELEPTVRKHRNDQAKRRVARISRDLQNPRTFTRYTPSEDLIAMRDDISIKEICYMLQRTYRSVCYRRNLLRNKATVTEQESHQ